MKTTNSKYEKQKQWFIDRIGKLVFRNKNTCGCDSCKRVFNEGLVIQDYEHACYLNDVSFELGITYYSIYLDSL